MSIKYVIILLFVLGIALSGLLFTVAGFLFLAPEALIGSFRVGIAVGCTVGGAIIFIPILVYAVLHLIGASARGEEKAHAGK